MPRTLLLAPIALSALFLAGCGGSGTGTEALAALDTVRWGQASCGTLKEGVTFRLEYMVGAEAQGTDELTITGDKADCTNCAKEGLTVSEIGCYENAPGHFALKVSMTKPDGGASRYWKGEVMNGVFSGSSMVSLPDGSSQEYSFTGRAVK
ncbi:MAG TPA: hypothetical protein PKE21_08165 [Flavobacteriales bacterium]|nr:hypothetical protein [Flavobacteriales bacterium]HMR27435.1 hypothetical protein [Flavobacteriales bacterium]